MASKKKIKRLLDAEKKANSKPLDKHAEPKGERD